MSFLKEVITKYIIYFLFKGDDLNIALLLLFLMHVFAALLIYCKMDLGDYVEGTITFLIAAPLGSRIGCLFFPHRKRYIVNHYRLKGYKL